MFDPCAVNIGKWRFISWRPEFEILYDCISNRVSEMCLIVEEWPGLAQGIDHLWHQAPEPIAQERNEYLPSGPLQLINGSWESPHRSSHLSPASISIDL